MRLWSLHPSHLDAKGLVALWREGLLAQKVLQGQTKGYTKHPQLIRFRQHPKPVDAIASYLHLVCDEAEVREYTFDRSKIVAPQCYIKLPVTIGQLAFEWGHLLNKLQTRDINRYMRMKKSQKPTPHPLFTVVTGTVESWEKVNTTPVGEEQTDDAQHET